MNKLKHPKSQSAGVAGGNKTQKTLTDTAVASHDNEVKVENISPDTSPAHQATDKPLLNKTFTRATQQADISGDDPTVKNVQDTRSDRTLVKSDKEGDRISQKAKKGSEEKVVNGGKTSVKNLPLQKERPKEVTGYAARYSQKRAAEKNNAKTLEREPLTTELLDINRPLLSPATRESMAKKRRCSDKSVTDDSVASSQASNVTSTSAPVRRTKHSSLASGKVIG